MLNLMDLEMEKESWDCVRQLMKLLCVCICDFVYEEVGGKIVATHASLFFFKCGNLQKKKMQNKSSHLYFIFLFDKKTFAWARQEQ